MKSKLKLFLEANPYFRGGEGEFLKSVVIDLPAYPDILEIGTLKGWSAILMAKTRTEAQIFTIDPHVGTKCGMHSSKDEANKNIFDSGCYGHVKHFPLSSQDYVPHIKFDLLFIDGDHTFEGVKHDFEKFLPFVKDKGIILFHDYSYEAGVTKFCDSLKYRAFQGFKGMLAIRKCDLC